MKAGNTHLLKFMKDAKQFVIPIYQRKYSWKLAQCEQLWQDVFRSGADDGGSHFVGSVVYVAEDEAFDAPLLVIDGQQRLTTITLLLTALANVLKQDEPLEGFSREKLHEYYLVNRLEKGDKKRKLLLSEVDSATLFAIVDGRDLPDEQPHLLSENYKFFKRRLEECGDGIITVCRGLSRLQIVNVGLSRKEDNPQLVFESMNSTRARAQPGRPHPQLRADGAQV